MLCFRLELVLLDCSVGLLGQEDEVPADSAAGAEGTAFETAAAEVGAGSA
jgi:hypothetical protein